MIYQKITHKFILVIRQSTLSNDANIRNHLGLIAAANFGHHKCADVLIKNGADVNFASENTDEYNSFRIIGKREHLKLFCTPVNVLHN